MKFTERVRQLELPADEYVVIGSGLLDALGLRAANDIDMVVSQALYARLKGTGRYDVTTKNGEQRLEQEALEIWRSWSHGEHEHEPNFEALFAESVVVDDIHFVNPQYLIDRKAERGTPQDLADIALLKAHYGF